MTRINGAGRGGPRGRGQGETGLDVLIARSSDMISAEYIDDLDQELLSKYRLQIRGCPSKGRDRRCDIIQHALHHHRTATSGLATSCRHLVLGLTTWCPVNHGRHVLLTPLEMLYNLYPRPVSISSSTTLLHTSQHNQSTNQQCLPTSPPR